MMREKISYYLVGQATSLRIYLLEQVIYTLFGWIPSVVGIGLRGFIYKLVLRTAGFPAIEHGVRLVQGPNIWLGRGVYLDHGVYLHATPSGIRIGDNTYVMHRSVLHVFNFRDLPRAGISIGKARTAALFRRPTKTFEDIINKGLKGLLKGLGN